MHPRKRLMLRRRDAAKRAAITTHVEESVHVEEPDLQEIVQKVAKKVAVEETVSVPPKKNSKKRSTRKTATTKKK